MIKNFSILVGRMLTTYVPGFETYKSCSIPHIKHKYSVEMSKKSDVVSSFHTRTYAPFIITHGTIVQISSIINFIVSELMQVPLGIILKNENKIDEMVAIMSELHQYIPTIQSMLPPALLMLEGKLAQKNY